MGLSPSRTSHYDLIKAGDEAAARGDHSLAVELFSGAAELAPDYWVIYIKRGRAYKMHGLLNLARSDVEAGLELEPRNVPLLKLQREVLAALGDHAGVAAVDAEIEEVKGAREARARRGLEKREVSLPNPGAVPQDTHVTVAEARYWAEVQKKADLQASLQNSPFARALKKCRRTAAAANKPDPPWALPPTAPAVASAAAPASEGEETVSLLKVGS
ncbi:hypothetical protein DIPPA_00054 [Diplonema papillatum]|nr:hypothetical protein DIPPA_00054 [Diplonema papillatum]